MRMDNFEGNLPRLACSTCRKQKRKCTRELPSCELCRKNRRRCEYPATPPLEGPGPFDAPVDEANKESGTSLASPRDRFPPLFFLDSYLFGRRASTVKLPKPSLPREFTEDVENNGNPIKESVEVYFRTIHKCFPIVSKRRFYQKLSSPNGIDADVVLLLLCMRLLAHAGDVGEEFPSALLYEKALRCFRYIEGSGIISTHVLQSGLLLAVYEAGNAIYPPAFLTIGHCARLGQAMGMHDRKNAPQLFPVSMLWTETEEIRRVWWGVIVLDRYIGLGIEKRPFACDDAQPEDLLPMDETLWELGEQAIRPSLAVSADTALAVSADTALAAPPFARTCQATHLLSHVLAHINTTPSTGEWADHYSRALKLHHILSSFHAAGNEEITRDDPFTFMALAPAMGICYSAMVALYDNHTCADLDSAPGVGIPEQLKIQAISLQGLHEVGASICEFASRMVMFLSANGPTIASPFVAEALYGIAKQYLWYIRETGKFELFAAVETLRGALQLIGQRWQVANEYLAILQGDDFQPQS